MSHGMKTNKLTGLLRDFQYGLVDAWHHLTEIKKKITAFKYEITREPIKRNGKETGFDFIVASDGGIVGQPIAQSYQFLNNADWLGGIQSVLENVKGAEIESLGTFDDLKKRYVTVRLNKGKDYKVGPRVFQPRFTLLGTLDKSGLDIGKNSVTCVVCANTFAMVETELGELFFGVKHTKNHKEKWEAASETLDTIFNRSVEFERLMSDAESVPLNEVQAHETIMGWLGDGREVSTKLINQGLRMKELFNTGAGNSGKTVLDMISSVTDYYTHESAGNAGSEDEAHRWKQFQSSEIGSASTLKSDFLNAIRKDDFTVNRTAIADLAKMGKRTLQLATA